MTPKRKAKDIYDKYNDQLDDNIGFKNYHIKYCALICVDIILNDAQIPDWDNDVLTNYNYWEEVKKEIEKL